VSADKVQPHGASSHSVSAREIEVTVIICTFNRAEMLSRTLASFFEQPSLASHAFELLVIDNNSTDETNQVVERFLTHRELRYVFEPKQGLSAARNRGVAEAKGRYVSFLDDDVLVDMDWMSELVRAFRETGALAVGGRSLLVFDADPPDWFGPEFRKLLSEVDLGDSRRVVPGGRGLFGLNLAFEKSALQAVGGFDENLGRSGNALLGGEEVAVLRRIFEKGGGIVYEPGALVGHIIEPKRMEWEYFERLAAGIGKSLAIRQWPGGGVKRIALGGLYVAALIRDWIGAVWQGFRLGDAYLQRRAERRLITSRSRVSTWRSLLRSMETREER